MKRLLFALFIFVLRPAFGQVNPPTITQNLGTTVTKVQTKGSSSIDSNQSIMVSALFSPQDTMVFCGTSVTAGTGASTPQQSYASILANTFNMVMFNQGVSGMTLSQPTGYVGPSFFNVYTTLIPPKRPHLRYLVIEFGENDAFFQFTGVAPFTKAQYISQGTTILNYALSVGWTAQTILMTAPEWQLPSRCPKVNQDSFYNANVQLATSFGLILGDDYISDQPIAPADKIDGVHPSDYGHARKAYILSTAWDSSNVVAKKYGLPYISQVNQIWEARHLQLRGLDSAKVGFAVTGVDPAGNLSAIPSYLFVQVQPPIPSIFQSGGIYTLGDHYSNGNGQFNGFRVTGLGSFPVGSGPGFELFTQGNDGHLFPFNRTTNAFGNIFADNANILQGVGTTPASFNTTGIYSSNSVQGNQGVFTGGFSPANVPALHCGFLLGGGWIESFQVNGSSTFFPTMLNPQAVKPVFVWTTTDNGKGALQIAGNVTLFHLVGTSGVPATGGLGTNVTSATLDANANDLSFTVTVVTSGAVSGTIFTVAPHTNYSTIPHPQFNVGNAATAAASSALWFTANSTSLLTFGGTISGAGTFVYSFTVTQ